jgi:hypothetical protein
LGKDMLSVKTKENCSESVTFHVQIIKLASHTIFLHKYYSGITNRLLLPRDNLISEGTQCMLQSGKKNPLTVTVLITETGSHRK